MTATLKLGHSSADSATRRTLSEISLGIAKSKRIVVVTGAGISCSSGIPDFRSSDGLYAMVKQQYPDTVIKGRDLFDVSLFRDPTSTAVFYTFMSKLKQSCDDAEPTPTHHFIKALDTKSKLLRSYTQNIDGLEERVGLLGSSSVDAKSTTKGKSKIRTKDVRNVQLHGDINRVRCTFCSAEFPCEPEHLRMFNAGTPPDCFDCSARSNARVARSARPLKIGTLRPAIVLYDEPHPLGDEIGSIQTADLGRKPDMLIIMGTSMKVHGLKKLVKDFARTVHATPSTSKSMTGKVIFVNRTPPGSEWANIIDYHVSGETDAWTRKVLDDWKKARPADWQVQQTLTATLGDISLSDDMPAKSKPAPKKKQTAVNLDTAEDGEENVRPLDAFFSSPMTVSSTPISPSKRRKTSNHYDDVESSPSKKHIALALAGLETLRLQKGERGLLFSGKEGGNNEDISMADASMRSMGDASMRDPEDSLFLGDVSAMSLVMDGDISDNGATEGNKPPPKVKRPTAPVPAKAVAASRPSTRSTSSLQCFIPVVQIVKVVKKAQAAPKAKAPVTVNFPVRKTRSQAEAKKPAAPKKTTLPKKLAAKKRIAEAL